jgi:hypothetical protein
MAILDDAELQGADLRQASFEEASLQGANLQNAELSGEFVNFTGADLEGADLRGTDLRGVELRGAFLRNADLRETNVPKIELEEAWGDPETTKLPDGLQPPVLWETAAPPLEEGSLPANTFEAGLFWPTLSFTVGEGWEVVGQEQEDYLSIARGADITFSNVHEVYDPRNPTEENVSPAPDELAAWLKGHPHLTVMGEKKVRVGGVPGVRLDVEVTSAPDNYPIDCYGPCVPLFPNGEWHYIDYTYTFIVLDVGLEKVVISIDPDLPNDEAQDVLDSVEWTYLPTREEIFSEAFEPGLSFIPGADWINSFQVPDAWYIWHGDSTLGFVNVDEVRDPQDPTSKDKAIPVPGGDLVGWLKRHPGLAVSQERQVPVGGVTGTQLNVSVRPTAPENYASACGDDPCLPLFHMNDGSSFWLYETYENQLTVLRVEGETVVISAESPPGEYDEFISRVEQVRSSVEWRD